jgi:branched-chain amino acid transport system ATP-binding protein
MRARWKAFAACFAYRRRAMQKAIGIIYDEHRSISAVLSGLRSLAQMAKDGKVRPDFKAFRAMIYYIDAFPERLHHPKEDQLLFSLLWEKSAEARPLVEKLRAEHVQGARLVRELERAVRAFEQSWPQGAETFAAAVKAYADFHWAHMSCEEQDLLPLAERALSEQDWAAIEHAFAQNDDPLAALRDKGFEKLYNRILSLAPAPIGLGAPWQRASQ